MGARLARAGAPRARRTSGAPALAHETA
jgi:hypothetical protein